MRNVIADVKRYTRNYISLAATTIFLFLALLSSTLVLADDRTNFIVDGLALILLHDSPSSATAALEELLGDAEANRIANESSSAAWLACARVRLWYADTLGPIAGFRQLKVVKSELEQAISLDGESSFAVAYLGFLYSTLPSWPLSFGNETKGNELITKALELDENAVGSNFLYAMLLFAQKDYERSMEHLLIARANLELQSMTPNEQLMMRNELDELNIRLESELPKD